MTDATLTSAAVPATPGTSQFDTESARKQWQVVARRFLRHRAAVLGSALFILLVLFAFFGSALWKYNYQQLGLGRYLPPSGDHPFGTGHLGEDMLSQIIRGTQFSLQIAIIVAVVATFIGVILGAVSGYRRGWLDSLINRGIDLVLVLPPFVIAAAMTRSTFLLEATKTGGQSSNWLLVAIFISLISWMSIARTVRGMVLSLREKEFVEAARALGGSTFRIVFKHILPNTIDVIIVNTTVTIAQAVLLEAALSFVGLGVQPPDTSLGLLINQNKNDLTQHPWLFFIPFLFIVAISLSVNFIGDGMRDAFDPRQKRVKA